MGNRPADFAEADGMDRDDSAVALGLGSDNTPLLWLRIPEGSARIRVASGPQLADGPFEWISAEAGERTDYTTCVELDKRAAGRAYEVLTGAERSIHSGIVPDLDGADSSAPVRIGFLSCHQPFDSEGQVTAEARASLQAALQTFREVQPDLILLLGDQIYADAPEALSLFDGDSSLPVGFDAGGDEGASPGSEMERQALIRKAYQRQYRRYAIPEWRQLQAEFPTLPILDDHDLVDNFAAEEGGELVEDHAAYRGAIQAYGDYQAARVLGPRARRSRGFHFSRAIRQVGLFVFDLRTQRDPKGGRIFSDGQRNDFVEFLRESSELPCLVLGASIPPLHVPSWAGTVAKYLLAPFAGDFADRLSSDAFVEDRDWLLETLRKHQSDHPEQDAVFLSGDIHVCGAWRADWNSESPPIHQVISSPITHDIPWWTETAARLSLAASRSIDVDGEQLAITNLDERGATPTSTPNFGLLTVPADGAAPVATLFGSGSQGARPLLETALRRPANRKSSSRRRSS